MTSFSFAAEPSHIFIRAIVCRIANLGSAPTALLCDSSGILSILLALKDYAKGFD